MIVFVFVFVFVLVFGVFLVVHVLCLLLVQLLERK